MATAQLASVLQQLRAMVHAGAYEDTSDRELLERFLAQREEVAFVALLKRHGPMVLQVCRRIQGNEHDAEDAFQATFLLLARKASSIRKLDSVASWLHGVAHRLALEAKTQEARRQMRERRAADMRNTSETADSSWQDLRGTLDEALRQLPEKYRTPLLLCYLEGKSHEEVARQLSCPIGTVHSRLARGRSRLKAVLERQGVCLSATALAAALAGNGMSATLPSLLFRATARAALAYSAGTAADVLVSARAAALSRTALDATLTAKLKMTIAVILALGAFGLGAGAAATHMSADPSHASAEATPPRSNATEDARPAPRKPASSPSTEAHQ